jgi:hypothetical protein
MNADRIRKQVYELLPGDLERFPIWEHALDEEGEPGQDEATVRPRPDLDVADPGQGLFVVRAEFESKDGTRFDGYAYPSTEDTLSLIQPTIVTEQGHVGFWLGAFPPEPAALAPVYELLGKPADALFPISFHSPVRVEGVELRGEIPAFLHFASIQDHRIVEMT